MGHLFSFKKDVWGLLLLCVIAVSSCTNEDEVLESSKVEPGIYTIERTIDAQNASVETRGVSGNNFDTNYDPDYIYLHCAGEALKIPVFALCTDCAAGFRYMVEVLDDGSAIITPIDENGEYMSETLTIPQDSLCYFSSWESDTWELDSMQISERTTQEGVYDFFHRKNEINKEIYRSESDYGIDDLVTNGDLTMDIACAGFSLVALFYDGEEESQYGANEGGVVQLTAEEFSEAMGDSYTKWYVKIYIGGSSFTDKYDLSRNVSFGRENGGYYSSGDSLSIANGEYDAHKYLQFSSRSFGNGDFFYSAFGYYTRSGNYLFTPVSGGVVNVYVLIKHWTGDGEPDGTWLLDDTDALYTKVNLSGTSTPSNGSFYTLGLLMDIVQFRNAWDTYWGDSSSYVSTRGLGLNGPREFFLKDAKVIFESQLM